MKRKVSMNLERFQTITQKFKMDETRKEKNQYSTFIYSVTHYVNLKLN